MGQTNHDCGRNPLLVLPARLQHNCVRVRWYSLCVCHRSSLEGRFQRTQQHPRDLLTQPIPNRQILQRREFAAVEVLVVFVGQAIAVGILVAAFAEATNELFVIGAVEPSVNGQASGMAWPTAARCALKSTVQSATMAWQTA